MIDRKPLQGVPTGAHEHVWLLLMLRPFSTPTLDAESLLSPSERAKLSTSATGISEMSVYWVETMVRRHCAIALLFLCASCSFDDSDSGSGQITLSPQVKASFEEYKARDAPAYFAVTESGVGSHYVYCVGGWDCKVAGAQMQALDQCRRRNPGEECKLYAIGRVVVWQDADAPRAKPVLSASDRLIRECLEGDTPEIRIDKCSQAIASSAVAAMQKRGPYYVRGRAREQVGSISEAEQDYRAVLTIDPDHAAANARLDDLRAPAAGPNAIPSESE